MEIISFWVDVEDASGTKLGKGPLMPQNWRQTARLDACGEFAFTVSGADPNLGALLEKRVVMCRYLAYGAASPQVFGSGVVDKIVRRIDDDGALWLDVSGNDIGRELSYRTVGTLKLAEGSAGVDNGPVTALAFMTAQADYVLDWELAGNQVTQTAVYAGFDGESVLTALGKIGEHIGEHWRIEPDRQVTWLGTVDEFADSGVRAVQAVGDPAAFRTQTAIAVLQNLEEESDCAAQVTLLIPRGAGNGSAVVTLATSTDEAPDGYTLDRANNTLTRADLLNTYTLIERTVEFKEIGPLSNSTPDIQAASNMLLQAAAEWLRRYGAPQKFYRLALTANTLLLPGTTMRVSYRQMQDNVTLYNLDDIFNILEVTRELDATGAYTSGVTVATIDRLPESDANYLAQEMQAARVLATHQQLSASTTTLPWRDEMDKNHGATLRFWLGDEYTSIQNVTFRFRVMPLRSTVKSVGATSGTTGAGGGSEETSSSGGGQTASGGSHGHNTDIMQATPNVSGIGWWASGGFIMPVSTDGNDYIFQVGVNTNHSHDIAAHTHSVNIPEHTHTVEPNIEMVYGIFEESGANTLALADLVLKLNNGADLRGNVIDIGGGWYALDLTVYADILDAAFRPRQESNALAITTAVTDKTARIEAQLTIRGVVQAVNYA